MSEKISNNDMSLLLKNICRYYTNKKRKKVQKSTITTPLFGYLRPPRFVKRRHVIIPESPTITTCRKTRDFTLHKIYPQ